MTPAEDKAPAGSPTRDPLVPLWWLSFADPTLPSGTQFLGVVVTQAATLEDAITGTHLLGINPGGQIGIMGPIPADLIAPEWRDRLLTRSEADAIPDPRISR